MTQFNNFPDSTTMSWTTATTELRFHLQSICSTMYFYSSQASSYDKTSKIILICLFAQGRVTNLSKDHPSGAAELSVTNELQEVLPGRHQDLD